MKLPRPQGIIESCEVKLEAPADVEVILNNGEQVNLELSKQPRPNEQTLRYRGVLANDVALDVNWRHYRPELRVSSVVDLTLKGDRGEVRHEIGLPLPPAPPSSLVLRIPPSVRGNVQVEGENPQDLHDVAVGLDGMIRLPIAAKVGATDWRRVLHYTIRLGENDHAPRAGMPYRVFLAAPEQATTNDIKVRVWSELGFLPRPADNPNWEERGIEEVKGRDLPVLVLHSTKLDAPLRLVMAEQAAGFSALVEGALVRVQLLEDGAQNWRASFQVRQLADGDLDLLLPGPVATLNAQFLFNRRKVTPDIINEKGEHTDGGNIARLHLPPVGQALQPDHPPVSQAGKPDLRQTALLEVLFRSPPGRSGRSPLNTILQPPQIRGAPAVPTRWQVSVPANRILIAPESCFRSGTDMDAARLASDHAPSTHRRRSSTRI